MAGRIRVHKADQRVTVVIGAVTGVTLAAEDLSPTGQVVIDWILLIVACTAVVWSSASTPWWALVVLAAGATVLAPPWAALIVGAGALVLALAVGMLRRRQPLERALVTAVSLLVLSVAREIGGWGVNSLIAVVLALAVAVLGAARRPRPERRLAWRVGAVAGGLTVLGLGGLAWAGLTARDELRVGNDAAQLGLRQLEEGQFEEARASFAAAAGAFESAADALDMPWAQLARVVPVAAQHRNAGATLSWSAADASHTIEEQLGQVDLDALRVVDGRIDLDAVTALQDPMHELQQAIDRLDADVREADNGWLVDPIRDRLDELTDEIAEQRALGERANDWLAVAPQLLGADRPRTYFVMFITPAEMRGQGGFMGNYAEVTIDQGAIEMTAFGRHTDLNAAIDHPIRLSDEVPRDWFTRYAQYGFAEGPELVVGQRPWTLIGLSPNFPSTAQVVADLYPQSGGTELDGVVSLDVYALEALIGLVGPIDVPDVPTLTGNNAAAYLMVDQYTRLDVDYDNPERIDALDTIARTVVDRLLRENPPDPLDLGRALAPLAEQRRVTAWLRDPVEQALVTSLDLDGAVLDDDTLLVDGVLRDGVAVTVNNEAGSKINAYVDQTAAYDPATDNLTVTFTNHAPASGLPAYVISAAGTGDPDGTAAMRISLFSTLPVDVITIDGIPADIRLSMEAARNVFDVAVKVPSGATKTVTFHLPAAQPPLVIDDHPTARRPNG